MIPYIFVFIISLLFISGASKFANQRKKIAFYFLSLGAILFPVLLAAYRDSSVGTDVQSYVLSIWEDAKIVDGDIQILMERWPHIEVLYLMLNSFCSKLSFDFSFLLFVIQLSIITPVFVGAMRTKNIAPPVFVMSIYYCLFYNELKFRI